MAELAASRRKQARQARQLEARDKEIGRLRSDNRKLKKIQFARQSERRGRNGKSEKRGAGESTEAAGKRGQRAGKPSPGRTPRPGWRYARSGRSRSSAAARDAARATAATGR